MDTRESYLGAVEALKGDRVFPFASGVTKSEKFSDLAPPSGVRRPRNESRS